MTTWVEGAAGSCFDVDNLPYGVFSRAGEEPRVGVRIGDHVLDLAPRRRSDADAVPAGPRLNAFMAAEPRLAGPIRAWITDLLTDETGAPTSSRTCSRSPT